MKLRLKATRRGALLCEAVHDVSDARSFGEACSDIWLKLAESKLGAATSIGAVYEALGESSVPDLNAVQISIERADP